MCLDHIHQTFKYPNPPKQIKQTQAHCTWNVRGSWQFFWKSVEMQSCTGNILISTQVARKQNKKCWPNQASDLWFLTNSSMMWVKHPSPSSSVLYKAFCNAYIIVAEMLKILAVTQCHADVETLTEKIGAHRNKNVSATSCNHQAPNPSVHRWPHPYSCHGFAWPCVCISQLHY